MVKARVMLTSHNDGRSWTVAAAGHMVQDLPSLCDGSITLAFTILYISEIEIIILLAIIFMCS